MKKLIWMMLFTTISLFAQKVIPYNGQQQELDARWNWAVIQAESQGNADYWIIYTFERLMPENSTIGHYYNGEYKGRSLAEILYPDRPTDYIRSLKGSSLQRSSEEVYKEIALVFDMNGSTVQDADMSTIDLYVRLDNKPVYWLGQASGQQSISRIISVYNDAENEETRENLVSAAGMHKTADKSFPFLKDVIQNEKSTDIKEDAVFWIGHLDNPQVVPFLQETALSAQEGNVAEKAVFSLYNINNEQAVDAVIYLAHEPGGEVREKAIFWLGQLAGKKALESLEEIAFSEEETEIQKQAVFALSQLENGAGIPKLIKIANSHPNSRIRKNAIFWLGESEDNRALDALIDMVKK